MAHTEREHNERAEPTPDTAEKRGYEPPKGRWEPGQHGEAPQGRPPGGGSQSQSGSSEQQDQGKS
jgi:hypothetical protein